MSGRLQGHAFAMRATADAASPGGICYSVSPGDLKRWAEAMEAAAKVLYPGTAYVPYQDDGA